MRLKNANTKENISISSNKRGFEVFTVLYKGGRIYVKDYIKKYNKSIKTLERDIYEAVECASNIYNHTIEYYYSDQEEYYEIIFN